MDPTPEQQVAIDYFRTGESLAIEAGAGTGKTSTLVMLARAGGPVRRGQYVAFNKSLVEESRAKFPLSVDCNTAHSLAFRAVGRNYAPRLNSSARMQSRDIASRLGIGYMEVQTFDGKPKTLYPGYLASLAMKTVTLFCQSADPAITIRHTPGIEGLDAASTWAVKESLVAPAKVIWNDLQLVHGGWVPYKHEHYLKTWQLQDPRINADFVLFDESQDANPVIAAIVANQAGHAQLVYVGDSQQEIYAWTGAVNALSKVEVANRSYLTQSFRFGQTIADRANVVLGQLSAPLRLSGNPSIESKVEYLDAPKAILTRTNATAVSTLLKLQEAGQKAHLIGGAGEILTFARGAQELMDTGHSSHPDLVCFDSWEAVRAYVQQDEGGEDLRLLVRLMDSFGSDAIVAGLEVMPREERADVIISTAHKSKGREWSSVQLAGDFPQTADSDQAALRLLYVSVTRAKLVLDDSALTEGSGETDGVVANEANVQTEANPKEAVH